MTNERMLELTILSKIQTITHINGKPIDRVKLHNRYFELMEEFLNPYVIDNTEKSE